MKVISIYSPELITIGAEVHDSEVKVDELYWWRHKMPLKHDKIDEFFFGNSPFFGKMYGQRYW